MAQRVRIETRRFGPLEAGEDELIQFRELPGFPGARRFIVRQHDRGSVFAWLISADLPELSFVIANPWHFFPDYAPEVGPRELEAIGAKTLDDVEIVAIVTVGRETLALNLAGPILINPQTRQGLQAILEGRDYSTGALVPKPVVTESPQRTAGASSVEPRSDPPTSRPASGS